MPSCVCEIRLCIAYDHLQEPEYQRTVQVQLR